MALLPIAHACIVISMATVCLPVKLISYSRQINASTMVEGGNFIAMLVIIILLLPTIYLSEEYYNLEGVLDAMELDGKVVQAFIRTLL